MEPNPLLETYLRQLHLPAFAQHYLPFAADAAWRNLDYPRYLLALVEQEIHTREQNRIQRRVKAARFLVLKELADFDFSALPGLNKARLLDLARGEYIPKKEKLIFIGNPGLGKHISRFPWPWPRAGKANVCVSGLWPGWSMNFCPPSKKTACTA